ncbi:hypothetical protein PLESTF_000141600 [Pleodorina starrii]|nr:hypothetical protein PLESTF_000141600 [Pleodorina starrii]
METYFLWPRICCALLLPHHVYDSIAPVLAAIHRGLGPATLVVLSFLSAERPSNLAVWGIRTWPFMDICFNAMFPTTPLVELVYGVLSLSWMLTLCIRYHLMFPDMPLQLPFKLVVCFISTAWLVLFQKYRRRVSQKRHLESDLQGSKASGAPSGNSSGAAGSSGLGGATSRSTGVGVGAGGLECSETTAPFGLAKSHAPPGHVPYIALPGRSLSIHIKIGNAEPEQIQADYRDRIAAVLRAAGLSLQHLYVRRGCIELTVDVRAESDALAKANANAGSEDTGAAAAAAAAAADDCHVDIGAIIQALQLDRQEDDDTDTEEEGSKLRRQQDHQAGEAQAGEALFSEPGSADDASSVSLSSSSTGSESELLSEPRLLATQCHPWTSRQQGSWLGPSSVPRITGLNPRVLATPPPPPPAGPADAAAVAAAPPPPVNIALAVTWPVAQHNSANDGGGSRELVLRSQGLYLPISVDCGDGPRGARSGARAGDDAADADDARPFGRSDCSAPPDVAPRQGFFYSVEVSGLPPCAGILLAEARLDGRCCSRPVPVLVMDDPRVAGELAQAFEGWGGTADELDALVVDLGTFFSQVAAVRRHNHHHHHHQEHQHQQAAHPAPACSSGGGAGAGGGGGDVGIGSSSSDSSPVQVRRLVHMGDHLLQYALACDWETTAGRLREDLQQLCRARGATEQPPCCSGSSSGPQASSGAEIEPSSNAPLVAAAQALQGPKPGSVGPAGAGADGGGPGPVAGGEAAVVCDGRRHLNRASPPAASAGPGRWWWWRASGASSWSAVRGELQLHTLPVELALLLALPLLHRRRDHGYTDAVGGALLRGCAAVAAGAGCYLCLCLLRRADHLLRPLLGRSSAAQPRLALYLVLRALHRALGLAAPPAVVAYELGLGFFLVEGVARPAFLGIEWPSVARIEALKFPLYLLLWGPHFGPWSAVARAAVVAGLSVVTSFACDRLLRSVTARSAVAPRKS